MHEGMRTSPGEHFLHGTAPRSTEPRSRVPDGRPTNAKLLAPDMVSMRSSWRSGSSRAPGRRSRARTSSNRAPPRIASFGRSHELEISAQPTAWPAMALPHPFAWDLLKSVIRHHGMPKRLTAKRLQTQSTIRKPHGLGTNRPYSRFLSCPPSYANWLILNGLGLAVGAWLTPYLPRLLCQRLLGLCSKYPGPSPRAPPAGPPARAEMKLQLNKRVSDQATYQGPGGCYLWHSEVRGLGRSFQRRKTGHPHLQPQGPPALFHHRPVRRACPLSICLLLRHKSAGGAGGGSGW